jgi:GTP cyclohydrolase II
MHSPVQPVLRRTVTIRFIESSRLPTPWGVFTIHGFEDDVTQQEHLALTLGNVSSGEPVLARIHSECLTGDALFSLRCDCGSQLKAALEKISEHGCGVLLYLRQEGRGIGLINKIKAYHLQDNGADTVQANEQLGFGADVRDYSMVEPMLEHLKVSRIRLLTNNPRKVKALEQMGFQVSERIPLQTGKNPHNVAYLATKAGKLGHLFDE